MPVEPCDFLCCAALMENKKRHEGEREREPKKLTVKTSLSEEKKKKKPSLMLISTFGAEGALLRSRAAQICAICTAYNFPVTAD